MPVFEIRYKKPTTDKAAEQIAEELDRIDAREIEENRWLLAGTREQVQMAFGRLREVLRRDALVMREVGKCDLPEKGYLSEEEITRYRDEAKD
jgi:hypothetical protein